MGRFHAILLAAPLILLSGCQPIAGKLTVARDLVLELTERNRPEPGGCLVRDGGCGDPSVRRVSANFRPGVYDAQLDMDDADALELTLADGTDNGAVLTIPIPEYSRLPKKSGTFILTANETKQPFYVEGNVQTGESPSPVTSGWEQCNLTVKRWICTHITKTADKSKQDRWCRYEYRTIYGQRPVEFHHVLKTRKVFLDFNAKGTGEKIAEFNGSAARNYKVYDYRGRCHADNIFVHGGLW